MKRINKSYRLECLTVNCYTTGFDKKIIIRYE
jgi:hypothetical protein